MEEAGELFDNINSLLLGHEELGRMDSENIDSLFRDMHTIKGGAGSVGLPKLGGYTHYLETFLDTIRQGELEMDGEIISFLIDGVNVMQEIMDDEYNDSVDEDLYNKQLAELKKSLESYKNPNKHQLHVEESNEQSQDVMNDLFDDLNLILEDLIEINSYDDVPIQELFRAVHTLKGSSLFLDVEKFPVYVHEIETLLDGVREKKYIFDEKMCLFLQESMQIARKTFDDELIGDVDVDSFNDELVDLKSEIAKFDFSENVTGEYEQAYEIFDGDEQLSAFELFEDDEPDDIEVKLQSFDLFDDEVVVEKEKVVEPKKDLIEEKVAQPVKEQEKKVESVKKSPEKVQEKKAPKKAAASSSIRVNLDKIDQLMNRVGDLVITKSMLFQFANSGDNSKVDKDLLEKLGNLDRDIRELQDSVMSVRMIPMESVYSRLPKMVRDLSKKLNKKVQFEHLGDSVEIDKMMVEGLMDPLTHIIRNSLDHGIESAEDRAKKGKKEKGILRISASQESGNIIISIYDDGAGINVDRVVSKALENGVIDSEQEAKMSHEDKLMLVFAAGLSTAEKLSDVSGRGVGMDVVMTNITSLGGHIQISSEKDKGSEFKIILPLTLAILDGLNVLVGEHRLILPLNNIVESLQPNAKMIKKVGENNRELLMLRHEFIPIIRLSDFFGIDAWHNKLENGMLIVVRSSNTKVALFIDEFLDQEQIVVKSLEKNYRRIKGIGAATIRGDGSIGLILDVLSILEIANKNRMVL
jgi:two-component system chemotaxis sensor kinase CheA